MEAIHIFDAIARDQKVIRATEDELQVEYISDVEDEPRKIDKSNREMVIHLFGTTPRGHSARIEVNGFHPFFYLALDTSSATATSKSKNSIEEKVCRTFPNYKKYLKFESVRKKKLIGYTGGKFFPFLKISMPSLGMFYDIRKMFLDDTQRPKFVLNGRVVEVYESNIDPMLRFFHIQNIQPCGWITVKGAAEEDNGVLKYRAEWDTVLPAAGPMVSAPFKHAFWDIECYSHDKEFPVAKQGLRRVAKQINGKPLESVPELLLEGFAAAAATAAAAIKIPPLKASVPLKKIRDVVESEAFRKGLAEVWGTGVDKIAKFLDKSLHFVKVAGDPIIQIGTVSVCGGTTEKHIFVLGGCAPIDGVVLHTFKDEKDLLVSWFDWLISENFDIMSGYNIFGFDERYIWERLEELGLEQEDCVKRMTRLWDEGGEMKLVEKFLSSSALGDNMLYMWNTPGRLRIDLYGHIKRKVQLTSYKLDSVCAAFLSGKLSGIVAATGTDRWLLKTKQKGDARLGRYVQVLNELGEDLSEKMEIVEVAADGIVVVSEEDLSLVANEAARWAVVKDDVSPQELFRLHRGTDADRARVAAYCIQDCDLVYELYKKLEVFNEAMSMANVCSVPVSYIFTRGQGIKIESLIFKDCMLKDQLIVVQPAAAFGSAAEGVGAEEGYEGAIVLDPTPGFYTDPVGVCDFASLYPSTIISENISHDSLVWTKDYDLDGKFVCLKYGCDADELHAPPGTRWTDIEFDILRPDPADTKKHPKKIRMGTRLCRYAQPPPTADDPAPKSSLPQIVAKLLAARKAKRVEITKTDDPFKKSLLDAEQNAYKITANSLYGQLGSKTFKIRLQDLAASVTAYARKQIMFSRDAIVEFYGPGAADPRCSAEIVYGDTDSLFVNFKPRGADGRPLEGREAVVATIDLTVEAGKFITGALKAPHDFEFDKVYYPFIIFSKKRYVGNKYEDSPDEFKETSMGIVLKRRDNAPLLKMIYGGAIDFLLNRRDIAGAADFVREKVAELVEGRVKLSQLTITKSLAADYAASPPAHKVLADRIAARDPGNAPASGDRIGFIYVQPATGQVASKLQGDRVETPAWIVEKGLKADAEYYIEHQLMNPLSQLFGILVEKMPGFVPPAKGWDKDPDRAIGQREMLAGELLFKKGLQGCRKAATNAFVLKMGGRSTAAAAAAAVPRAKRAPPASAIATAAAVAGPKKQASLDKFLKDTALIGDTLLARGMRKTKTSLRAAAAAAEAAAAAPHQKTPI